MKILKGMLGIAILLVIVMVVVGFSQDPKWRVERSVVVNASPPQVFEYIQHLKDWPQWSAWNPEKYPDMSYSTSDPDFGVGAKQSWNDGGMTGELVISDYKPNDYFEYDLSMDGGEYQMRGRMSVKPADGGTRLTWACWGDSGANPFDRLMMLMFKPMIGDDFQVGLDNVKQHFAQ